MSHGSANKGDRCPPPKSTPPRTVAELAAGIARHHREIECAFGKPLRDLSKALLGGNRGQVVDTSVEIIAASHDRPPVFSSQPDGRICRSPSPHLERSPGQPTSSPIHSSSGPQKRRAGRRKMKVDDMTCEQWMAAEAVKDQSVTRRTGRQWAAEGPWKSPRTYEKTDLFKAWKKVRSVQDTVASEQVRVEFSECSATLGEKEELDQMCVSARKSSLGKPRRSAEENSHERDVKEFLARAERENKPAAQ